MVAKTCPNRIDQQQGSVPEPPARTARAAGPRVRHLHRVGAESGCLRFRYDRGAFAALYRPEGVPHEVPPDPDHEDYGVRRIKVGRVTVRYEQGMSDVRMTVEGVLPDDTIRILRDDLLEKLSKVEATKYEFRQLRP